MAKADYIRLFAAAYPTATVRQIATLLAARGIHCRPEYVRVCKKRPPADPKKLKNAARSAHVPLDAGNQASTAPDAGIPLVVRVGVFHCSSKKSLGGFGRPLSIYQLTPAPLCVGGF